MTKEDRIVNIAILSISYEKRGLVFDARFYTDDCLTKELGDLTEFEDEINTIYENSKILESNLNKK